MYLVSYLSICRLLSICCCTYVCCAVVLFYLLGQCTVQYTNTYLYLFRHVPCGSEFQTLWAYCAVSETRGRESIMPRKRDATRGSGTCADWQ